ncbi:MAG TPA: hypothetical protein VGC18_12490 [Lacisediminihabitans sp.]|uniref:hypothetical protein n=1 Tax=Lacisediminihabitans sp. TaxID=2787631 RepID=UPI002EDAAB6F
MTLQTVANVLLLLVLVGWIASRQLRWQPVVVSRMWRLPIALGIVGLITLSGQSASAMSSLDVAVLVIELVVALGLGALMGSIARFRRLPEGRPVKGNGADAPEFESRTGWLGAVLWVLLIAVRLGIEVWATQAGSAIAASTGVILIVIAANRIARTAVFAARIAALESVAA